MTCLDFAIGEYLPFLVHGHLELPQVAIDEVHRHVDLVQPVAHHQLTHTHDVLVLTRHQRRYLTQGRDREALYVPGRWADVRRLCRG